MNKLIGLDLDGTLLTDDKRILHRDVATIERLSREGNTVIIVTGRRYYSAREILMNHGLRLPIISNNGSIIRDSLSGPLFRDVFRKEEFNTIMETFPRFHVDPVFHIDGMETGFDLLVLKEFYGKEVRDYCRDATHRMKIIEKGEDPFPYPHLAMLFVGKPERLKEYEKFLKEKYPHLFNVHILENLKSETMLLEVLTYRTNKWNGMMTYARSFGFRKEDIIAVGDDTNDLAMVTECQQGIAMINGAEILRRSAKFVSRRDNNSGGAIQAVLELLEGRET